MKNLDEKQLYEAAKRAFDFSASVIALGTIWPIMVGIALSIKVDSPGPALYLGRRSGRYGVPFEMLKFRTMVANAEMLGGPSTGLKDPRITRTGKFLRKYKLDELPQLVNVIKGEMSVVGPRPEVLQYTALYQGEEREILSVRPGITDYSSIEFANLQEVLGSEDVDNTFETKVMPRKTELRLKYVQNRSFKEDMKIIFRTFSRLIKK